MANDSTSQPFKRLKSSAPKKKVLKKQNSSHGSNDKFDTRFSYLIRLNVNNDEDDDKGEDDEDNDNDEDNVNDDDHNNEKDDDKAAAATAVSTAR